MRARRRRLTVADLSQSAPFEIGRLFAANYVLAEVLEGFVSPHAVVEIKE